MDFVILNIIIGLCTALIGVLAFADKIKKYKYLIFLKSLKNKIFIFFMASLIIVLATIQKDLNSESQIKSEQVKAEKDLEKRDSLNKLFLDENNRKLITTFTDALVQYGLKYDSAKKEIERIVKDSSKKIIQYNYGSDPTLTVNPNDGIKFINSASGDNFEIRFKNFNATSKNINILIYCCVWERTDTPNVSYRFKDIKHLLTSNQFATNYQMLKDHISSIKLNLKYSATSTSMYYFLIKGSYSNSDNTKKFTIDALYTFNFYEKKFGGTTEPSNSIIRNILTEKGIL